MRKAKSVSPHLRFTFLTAKRVLTQKHGGNRMTLQNPPMPRQT